MDQYLYDVSLPAISSLQHSLAPQAALMQLLSVVFDPKYAFLIYSPIAFLFDPIVGKRLILTTVIAEWLNQILKWLFHGERPYWYVHSSGHFDPQQVPIKQFPITCELGPGHPSGHAMVTAAVWFIILDSILQLYRSYAVKQPPKSLESQSNGARLAKHDNRNSRSALTSSETSSATVTSTSSPLSLSPDPVNVSIWTVYAILLALVSVSRVFLGCHFPHQCLAGAALGLALAKYVSRLEPQALHFVGGSVFMFASAFGTFGLLQALGVDPGWTIKLATKHCEKREYIHVDTAPFFSVMRYCGFALGSGLGLLLPVKHHGQTHSVLTAAVGAPSAKEQAPNLFSSKNFSWISIKVLMALVMSRLVDNLGLFVSHANLTVFYSSAFAAYTAFSYAFMQL